MPKIESLEQMKAVNIDFPFEQSDDYRLDGLLTTSFETIKEMVNRAVEIGFNTISFDTNVPIDINTGSVITYIPESISYGGNRNKSFSEAVWKGIEYAESLGLKTVINLNIRNALNDDTITKNNSADTLDSNLLFSSVIEFETDIAVKAQDYGVDRINIGAFNSGYDQREYLGRWEELVASLRSVYAGSLGYRDSIGSANNPIFDIVDHAFLLINTTWSLQSDYKAEDFVSLYFGSSIYGDGETSTYSANSQIQNFLESRTNNTVSFQVMFAPGNSSGHELENIWSYVYESNDNMENAKDVNSLRLYPEKWIDTALNDQKIAGFFEYIGNYLSDRISGFEYYQFAPWTEANWLRAPFDFNGQVWQSVMRASFYLNWNPSAQEMLSKYLTEGWGTHFLYYGTEGDDSILGSSAENRIFSYEGNDFVDGGPGIDTLVYSSSISQYTISKLDSGFKIFSAVEDTDTLINVERLEFSDVNIALDLTNDGHAAVVAKILGAVFGKESVANKEYAGIGLHFMDSGMSYQDLAALALNAAGATSNDAIVSLMWKNVVGTDASAADKAPFIAMLEDGMTPGALAQLAGDTEFNTNNINLVGLASTGLEYLPFGG